MDTYYIGLYWIISDYIGLYWIILYYIGLYWIILEYIGIGGSHWNSQDRARANLVPGARANKIYWNSQDRARANLVPGARANNQFYWHRVRTPIGKPIWRINTPRR